MRTRRILTAMTLMILSFNLTMLAFTTPSIEQTTTTPCPTYLTVILVDLVDSNPKSASVGMTVVTRFHVIYPDGTPVTLSPETASFLWTGPSGQKEYNNVPVVFNGTPGFYNYTQTVISDLVNAVGQGRATISVIACSCSDINGNRGPTNLTNSENTLTPADDSHVTIGPTGPQGPISGVPTELLVPIIIAILLLIALLLFLLRSRRKKQS